MPESSVHQSCDIDHLPCEAATVRERVLRLAKVRPIHLGAALSCTDILVALYFNCLNQGEPAMRDRVVLSKGHGVYALYSVLASVGILPEPLFETFSDEMNPLAGHPVEIVPGIDVATGALGHGLSIAVGMALAAKRKALPFSTAVILGDGELNEGSVWEAAMFAASAHVGHLLAIVDRNGQQQEGPTEEILRLEPIASKWSAFGWNVVEADGHDFAEMIPLFVDGLSAAQPTCVIAHTVKGRGVSFMEDDPTWHMGVLDQGTYEAAVREVRESCECTHSGR